MAHVSVEARRVYNRTRYNENPEARASRLASTARSMKRRRATADGWQMAEIRRIKHRAKQRGLAFNITKDDIPVPEVCPVLGIPITLGAPARSPGLPSIDRKIPSLGYVKGNVVVISWRANNLKHDCTSAAELRAVADYIERGTA